MKVNYIKHEEIAKAKAEGKQVLEDMKIADQRLEDYRGMSDDHKECQRLRKEQIRLVDLIGDLKDYGKIA